MTALDYAKNEDKPSNTIINILKNKEKLLKKTKRNNPY